MPDPRTTLETYEDQPYEQDGVYSRYDAAPYAFDALRAVLDAVDTWRQESWQPPVNGGDYTAGYVAGALAATFAHEGQVRRVIAEKLGGQHE